LSQTWCLAGEAEVVLEVQAGDHDREDVIVSTPLPVALRGQRPLGLVPIAGGTPLPVQVEDSDPPRVWWILPEKLPAGTSRRYRLRALQDLPPVSAGVTVDDDGKQLLVKVRGKAVLAYNQAIVPSPNPQEPYYAKSGYIHPLFNPSGDLITDDFNPDHPHQHGIMFAWRKTTFEGRATNGWDQKAGTGRVEHVQTERFGGGPVFGHFTARLRQVDLTAPHGPRAVFQESWTVRVYNLAERFMFDLEATQTCACDQPVRIEEISYGALMIRGRADWTAQRNFDYLTSEGRTKRDGDQTRPRWVDLHGPVGSRLTGVAILDHPQNFRFPQPVRLAPETPYFCFTPASAGSFAIGPGQPYRSRFRYAVHDGQLDARQVDRLWHDYAQPPAVRCPAD
jgi:hypothetical protein